MSAVVIPPIVIAQSITPLSPRLLSPGRSLPKRLRFKSEGPSTHDRLQSIFASLVAIDALMVGDIELNLGTHVPRPIPTPHWTSSPSLR